MQRTCGIERAVGILALLLTGSVANPVAAQSTASEPTPEQVRAAAEAFDLGRQSYKDGRFAEAAEQFERADASAPNATALELAIRARDKAGDLDRAGTLASLALTLYPNDENIAKIAPDVIERASTELYQLIVSCSEACEISDGNKVVHGVAATRRTLFLAPGTHNLQAGFKDGHTLSKSVEAAAGGNGIVEFTSAADEAPAPEAPPPPPPEPVKPGADEGVSKKGSGLSPIVFFSGVGATAVLGAVTIWSGVDTVNNPGADKVKAECAAGDENCKLYQEGRSKQARTNVLIGVTGVVGVATAVIGVFATNWGGGHGEPVATEGKAEPRVTPYFGWANGPALGARGAF